MIFQDKNEYTLMEYDEVRGKNIQAIGVNLTIVAKRIMNRLPIDMKASPLFLQLHGFKVGTSISTFEPFTLEFGDGQLLTALIENVRITSKKPDLKKALRVREWFLNRRRVTELVYMEEGKKGQNRGVSDAETAKNIAELIIKTHDRFIKGNKVESATVVKKRIRAIDIDVSNIIQAEKTYAEELGIILEAVRKGGYSDLVGIEKEVDIIEANETETVINSESYKEIIKGLETLAAA
jgi:hypothetical protein